MDGFINTRPFAYGSRSQHAHGARDLRRLIGEDVAKKIRRHDYVEPPRVFDEEHRQSIHELMFNLDIGIVFGYFLDNFAPQPRCLEDIGLVDGTKLLAARTGSLEGLAGNAFYFETGILRNIKGGVAIVLTAFLAEIDIAGELAEEQDIGPAKDLRLDARSAQQLVE